jgi:hypothetical protein
VTALGRREEGLMGLRTIEPETQSLFSDEIIEENENQSPGTNVFDVGSL